MVVIGRSYPIIPREMSKVRGPVIGVAVAIAFALVAQFGFFFYRDNFSTHYPLKVLSAASFRTFEIPYWDFNDSGGQPLAGNPGAQTFYPDNLLYLFLPVHTAFNLHFLLHLALAFFAMRALCRSTFAATVYVLSGVVISSFAFYNFIVYAALIPLALYAAERRSWRLLGVACGLMGLAAEPVLIFAAAIAILIVVAPSLIRPSATFSPQAGRRATGWWPLAPLAGRGWREAPGEGRVRDRNPLRARDDRVRRRVRTDRDRAAAVARSAAQRRVLRVSLSDPQRFGAAAHRAHRHQVDGLHDVVRFHAHVARIHDRSAVERVAEPSRLRRRERDRVGRRDRDDRRPRPATASHRHEAQRRRLESRRRLRAHRPRSAADPRHVSLSRLHERPAGPRRHSAEWLERSVDSIRPLRRRDSHAARLVGDSAAGARGASAMGLRRRHAHFSRTAGQLSVAPSRERDHGGCGRPLWLRHSRLHRQ